MRYLRFVISEKSPDSGFRYGFICGAYEVQNRKVLEPFEEDRLEEIFAWFNEHLHIPDRFSRKRNANHRKHHGLSWFKDTASEHLQLAREVVEILRPHGVVVDILETERPGFVVYEDEFQVVAEPFADTRA